MRLLERTAIASAVLVTGIGSALFAAGDDASLVPAAKHLAPEPIVEVAPSPLVPTAEETATARAVELGLGERAVAAQLLTTAPDPHWTRGVPASAFCGQLTWPVDGGHLSRGFGYVRKTHPSVPHEGVDILAPEGTPVLAAAPGLVVYADRGLRGYGKVVFVLHADESVTLYAHLSEFEVNAGQTVAAGEVLGAVGKTGLARGAHLHFEWRHHGDARNPVSRFDRIPERRAVVHTI
ncbi:MAG: M23 family metallopeptidase [Myxococcota bacterium]